MADTQATAELPFGQFFARALGRRELPGFTLTRLVPHLRKRDVPRHRHDDAHFVFVLRGNYETGAKPPAQNSGPLHIYSPPGTTHRDCFLGDDLAAAALATLSVSASALATVEAEVALPGQEICLGSSADRLVTQLLVESRGPSPGEGDDLSEHIAEALCLELLARTGIDRDAASNGAPAWLHSARELLRDTCLVPGPRSVREIAGELAVHPVHLARRFRRHFATTPGEYLRRCRLDHARRLLNSRAGLADIATATGFSDQSHFTNAFRNRFGVSPGAFRSHRPPTRSPR